LTNSKKKSEQKSRVYVFVVIDQLQVQCLVCMIITVCKHCLVCRNGKESSLIPTFRSKNLADVSGIRELSFLFMQESTEKPT